MLDQAYYIRLLEILSKDTQDKNTYAQANAKHILMSVDTDPADYPRFNLRLSDQADAQAFLYLEIGAGLFDAEREQAVFAFEKGAQLIEYNHSDRANQVSTSNYILLVGALAYYCARQYSKSFILLKKVEDNTRLAELIKALLSKDLVSLRRELNDILLVNRDEVDDYDSAQLIIFAETLSLLLHFVETGEKSLITRVDDNLASLLRLSEIDRTPDTWWVFRLMRIVADTLFENSLWTCLEGLDITNNLTSKYIRSLAFRSTHPVIELFPSQKSALEKVLSDSGAVVCLPTSSGKTRIAEICILQTFIRDVDAKVLYIAPFRSLAFEIEESFSEVFRCLRISVTHLYGGGVYTKMDQDLIEDSQLLIATPEKAKAILRGNKELFESIKLVVSDEGHLIGLENRYLANEIFTEELKRTMQNNGGKFVLLSAVLPNPKDIAEWIAEGQDNFVTNSWRASSQRLGLMSYTGDSVNIDWMSEPPGFNRHFVEGVNSKNDAVAKTAKKLSAIGSVMVFVAQAKSVLSQGRAISLVESNLVEWGDNMEWKSFVLACKESGFDEVLEFAKKGIMCHSNKLPSNVRRSMESLLRIGKVKYIVATNTLAQGVNVGVSVVIFHSVDRAHNNPLPTCDFWNIAGRAGRAFVDSEGIILYLLDQSGPAWKYKNQKKQAMAYFNSSKMEKVHSGIGLLLKRIYSLARKADISFDELLELLSNDNLSDLLNAQEITRLTSIDDGMLSLIADGDEDAVDNVLRRTLAYIQEESDTAKEMMLKMLKARVRAVKAKSKGTVWERATALGIPLDDALHLQDNIEDYRKLAVTYITSDENVENLLNFLDEVEGLLDELPSGKFRYGPRSEADFHEVQEHWIKGDSLAGYNKGQKYVNEYISFILPWAMNAVARELILQGNENEAMGYLSLAACCESGLPTISAVKVFKSGIQSRVAASVISTILGGIQESSISTVAQIIEEQKDTLIAHEKTDELTKEWVSLFYEKRNNPKDRLPVIPKLDFTVRWEKHPNVLYCSRKGNEYYLRSVDYQWIKRVEPSEELPFDLVADILGVGFAYVEGDDWKMFNKNVWYKVTR